MSPTDLIFAFVSLLLGLGIAEVLGGLARIIVARRVRYVGVRLGWLTPLIALFVVVDLTSFWLLAYEFREQFRATFPMLVGVLAICGLYYVVAVLVFPDEAGDWTDLDDYYDRQRRVLVGGILSANFLQVMGQLAVEILVPAPDTLPEASDAAVLLDLGTGLGILAILLALLWVRKRRANLVLLVLVNALVLVGGTVSSAL